MIKTLNAKLSLALMAVVMSAGLGALIIGQKGMHLYYEELTQRLNANIAMYITSSYELLADQAGDKLTLKMLADRATIVNPTVEVYLLDVQGRILSHVLEHGELKRTQILLDPIHKFIAGGADYPLRGGDPRHVDVDKIFSASEIRRDNVLKGYLYVVLGGRVYDSIGDNIVGGHINTQMFWSLFLMIAGCIAVGLLLFRYFIRPLNQLSDSMTQFVQAELNAVDILPKCDSKVDEIETLNCVFKGMSVKISDQLEQLRNTDRLRRELISNVSHDLRTPLATIQGYVETLIIKDKILTVEQRMTYLQSAQKGCSRLSRLITDLFELSRLESGSKTPILEGFSVAELVSDTAQGFQLALEANNLSLSIDCPENCLMVYADIGMIQRVLDNLLRNAIAHTPSGGKIKIRLAEENKGISIVIEDTGKGIKEQDLPNIFNRYYQSSLAPASAGNSSSGGGLGLAIVKRILDFHESDIKVDSKINTGTRFCFTLSQVENA